MYRSLLALMLWAILLSLSAFSVHAQACAPLYGGGAMDCSKPIQPKQTKGGLPIHPKPDAKTTPATGPEAIALISLIPIAIAGFYLRHKT